MPQARVAMRKFKEALRLHSLGRNKRQISVCVRIASTSLAYSYSAMSWSARH